MADMSAVQRLRRISRAHPACLVDGTKMKPLPQNTIKSVQLLLKKGLSYRAVMRQVWPKLSYGSIVNIAKKTQMERPAVKNGRPAKLSEAVKRNLVRSITMGKYDTAVEAARNLKTLHGISVTAQTIRNALKKKVSKRNPN